MSQPKTTRVLSVSDRIEEIIYSTQIRERFADVDFVISCGDLPYYYTEYIVSALNVPVFFVRGNHAKIMEQGDTGPRSGPHGAIDLHRQVICHAGLLLAGVEGSVRYKDGPFQYSQAEMWGNVWSMVPRLLQNKARFGRYLDIFVTHASPWGIHDQPDWPHQGIHAFRWLIEKFKPRYHFHGHIHLYGPNNVRLSEHHSTTVINTYGYLVNDLELQGYRPIHQQNDQ